MIHNSFQLNKKLEKMEHDINELKLKNSELIDNCFLKADKFTELTHRLNDISLEIVNIKNNLEKAMEQIENQKKNLIEEHSEYEFSENILEFIEKHNYTKYSDKFKYMGIKTIEDFLILNSYELNENGILYVDAKKIIENAKEVVESSETMV
tara:strand:- start:747 stop:1202 length:456 start_codon:yes stop_codon:yes gene_type:complete